MSSTASARRYEQGLAYCRTAEPSRPSRDHHIFAGAYAWHLDEIDQLQYPDRPLPTPADFALEYELADLLPEP